MVFKRKADKRVNQQELKSGKEGEDQLLKGKLVLQNSSMDSIKTSTKKIMHKPINEPIPCNDASTPSCLGVCENIGELCTPIEKDGIQECSCLSLPKEIAPSPECTVNADCTSGSCNAAGICEETSTLIAPPAPTPDPSSFFPVPSTEELLPPPESPNPMP